MPFVSEAQRRACYVGAMPGVDCHEWESKTEGKLPRKRGTRNSVSKIDPSRTISLRRAHIADLKRRFGAIKKALLKLVGQEDAFGLDGVKSLPTGNFNPNHDEQGRFASDPLTKEGGDAAEAKGVVGMARDKAQAVLEKVPGAKWLQGKLKTLNDAMTQRYGAKQALAIVASGQAVGWGISIVGTATTGVPVYVPFSTIVGMVPGAALAEIYYQLKGKKEGAPTKNALVLSQEAIAKLGLELVNHLMDLWRHKTGIVANAGRYAFHTSPEKVKAFQKWLQVQQEVVLTSPREEDIWRRYAEAGYKKGAGRAFDDTKREVPTDDKKMAHYQGTKDEFLRSTFAQPVSVEKIKLLAGRSFDDLKNVTSEMSTRMSRTLTDALVEGKGAKETARDLAEDVDISQERALVVARTEIIRAHAEGQLDAFEQLGVEQLGVEVEWATAGDDRVCPECAEMGGMTFDIEEARGMIPVHPNCRCAFVPVIPEALTENRSHARLMEALAEAFEKGVV